MTKKSETIVFFGNERLATGVTTTAPTLQALVESGYHVAAVVSHYETGQSRNARSLEIKDVAERYKIPLLLPSKPADIIETLRSYDAVIGVLVAYGKIVPQAVIDIFPNGIVNIHPSLLPVYRGPTPIEQVILDGKEKTGVSIMQLVKEMDAGPVFAQSELALSGTESKQALADTLLEIGGSILIDILPGILEGSVVALPQDESRATYDSLISKDNGIINWTKSALQLQREIRAYLEWPKSQTKFGDKEVIITSASVVGLNGTPGQVAIIEKDIVVYAGAEALKIEKLKPAGKQEMSAQEFLRGYGHLL